MLSIINETDNKNFYPTPLHLVNKMMNKVKDWRYISTVLEPSAGKGDIAKLIENRNSYSYNENKIDLDCIEIDTNMQHILKGEGFKVVHDDFLSYNGFKKYDLIIMNPPFDYGEKHLLKALDMQKRGGQIVCLLNAETLLNPCTNARKELVQKLTDLEADIEFLKDEFNIYEAERKTNVQIALIYVNIAEDKVLKDESYIYEEMRQAKEEDDNEYIYESKEVTTKLDFIEQIVEQYEFEVKGTLKLIREYEAFRPYMKRSLTEDKYCGNDSILTLTFKGDTYNQLVNINEYLKIVRLKYWTALFENEQFTSMLTSNLLDDYRKNINKMSDYDFTIFNIKSLQFDMSKNMVTGVEQTILTLFEELSHKISYWDEGCPNIHYYNGWKTNKAYIVGKKVILPYVANIRRSYDYRSGERVYYSYFDGNGIDKLRDMEKVFNYLDGGLTDDISIDETLRSAAEEGQTKNIEMKYFKVTFYKKGTCHIVFKNEELLKKFNIFGSQRKGWLPPSYGKAKYKDMTQEEKAVIDEFEGEKEYDKVIVNKNYYITETSSLLSLTT